MGKAARRKRERAARDRQELLQDVISAGPPKPATPMEQAFADRDLTPTWEPLYEWDKKVSLWLSTPALKNMSRMAREAGMTRAYPEELEDELDPNGRHVVMWAARHWSADFRYDNVRAMIGVATKTWLGGIDSLPQRIIDLPTRQFALLCTVAFGSAKRPVFRLAELARSLGYDIEEELNVPSWTGTRSMDLVANEMTLLWALAAAGEVYGATDGVRDHFVSLGWPLEEATAAAQSTQGPRPLVSGSMLTRLRGAHPIVCEPEWIQAMDDFHDWEEAFTFSQQVHLPFDAIYLDLTGPGGYTPQIPITAPGEPAPTKVVEAANGFRSAKVAGALLWRHADGHLMIVPFGVPAVVPNRKTGFSNIDGLGFSVHDILGVVKCNTPGATGEAPWSEVEVGHTLDMSLKRKVVCAAPLGGGPRGRSPIKIPAQLALPFSMKQVRTGFADHPDEFVYIWASCLWAAARRILRTLHMLQAGNVELVEAQVSRQVRRAGQRAGQSISKQVIVRLNRKAYVRPPGIEEGEPIEWSHAWWVSGHPRYYPVGTRKADAQSPEKLIQHPTKGICFMEWVAPYIKGAREKGVVEKTRIVRDRKDAA